MSDPAERLNAFLARTPYARFLGVRAELAGDEMTAVLPFDPKLIGNAKWQALHGGVLGAFMEMTALAQLALSEDLPRLPKAVDVTIEYLKTGRPQTTFARADLRKVGKRIANVHVEAWQDQRSQPVAALRGHFLLPREG
jgi:uncharacterized protein (TIGR00369 family)